MASSSQFPSSVKCPGILVIHTQYSGMENVYSIDIYNSVLDDYHC